MFLAENGNPLSVSRLQNDTNASTCAFIEAYSRLSYMTTAQSLKFGLQAPTTDFAPIATL